jgi:CheY-like chemotaxis protein
VIEDDADSREATRLFLSGLGCEVLEAEDGYSALTIAVSLKPHLVLVDVGLPELDGYQVGEALRAVLGSSARLVAVSGHRPDEAGGLKFFDGYLLKPVAPDQLARLCGRGRPGPPRGAGGHPATESP